MLRHATLLPLIDAADKRHIATQIGYADAAADVDIEACCC